MLTLSQVLLDSRLTLICGEDLEITQVEGFYIGDLLSFVMGKAKKRPVMANRSSSS